MGNPYPIGFTSQLIGLGNFEFTEYCVKKARAAGSQSPSGTRLLGADVRLTFSYWQSEIIQAMGHYPTNGNSKLYSTLQLFPVNP